MLKKLKRPGVCISVDVYYDTVIPATNISSLSSSSLQRKQWHYAVALQCILPGLCASLHWSGSQWQQAKQHPSLQPHPPSLPGASLSQARQHLRSSWTLAWNNSGGRHPGSIIIRCPNHLQTRSSSGSTPSGCLNASQDRLRVSPVGNSFRMPVITVSFFLSLPKYHNHRLELEGLESWARFCIYFSEICTSRLVALLKRMKQLALLDALLSVRTKLYSFTTCHFQEPWAL